MARAFTGGFAQSVDLIFLGVWNVCLSCCQFAQERSIIPQNFTLKFAYMRAKQFHGSASILHFDRFRTMSRRDDNLSQTQVQRQYPQRVKLRTHKNQRSSGSL